MNREALRLAGVTLSREEPASKRSIAKDYHRNLRRIDEPDEVRKVACCPKCPAWFESVEMRNEHRKMEHRLPIRVVVGAPIATGDIEIVPSFHESSEPGVQPGVYDLAEG